MTLTYVTNTGTIPLPKTDQEYVSFILYAPGGRCYVSSETIPYQCGGGSGASMRVQFRTSDINTVDVLSLPNAVGSSASIKVYHSNGKDKCTYTVYPGGHSTETSPGKGGTYSVSGTNFCLGCYYYNGCDGGFSNKGGSRIGYTCSCSGISTTTNNIYAKSLKYTYRYHDKYDIASAGTGYDGTAYNGGGDSGVPYDFNNGDPTPYSNGSTGLIAYYYADSR